MHLLLNCTFKKNYFSKIKRKSYRFSGFSYFFPLDPLSDPTIVPLEEPCTNDSEKWQRCSDVHRRGGFVRGQTCRQEKSRDDMGHQIPSQVNHKLKMLDRERKGVIFTHFILLITLHFYTLVFVLLGNLFSLKIDRKGLSRLYRYCPPFNVSVHGAK